MSQAPQLRPGLRPRQPEKTAPYQVMQEHLLTFEQKCTDEASGRTLPKLVPDELRGFSVAVYPLRFA